MIRLVLLVAMLALGVAAVPASAAVMDIAPDGRVTVIDVPSVQLSSDPGAANPIHSPRSPGPAPSRVTAPMRAAEPVRAVIRSAARAQGLGTDLVDAVAWQESRYRADAVSPRGAVGVMQLMPATARTLGVRQGDVSGNVHGGAAYLRLLMTRYDGDLVKALAAYNAGPAAVDRHGGPPPYKETRAYVDAVLERLAERVVPLQQPLQRRHP